MGNLGASHKRSTIGTMFRTIAFLFAMAFTLLGWLLMALGLTLRAIGWSLMVTHRLFRALAATHP